MACSICWPGRCGTTTRCGTTCASMWSSTWATRIGWKIEESFQSGKELAAPDEHQLRRWTSWQRWTILAILAHAFLSVMTATQSPPDPDSKLIPLTRNEIRRLFVYLLTRTVRTARQISTGHNGGADTKPEPEPATTADTRALT
jgi:hypothetical protein